MKQLVQWFGVSGFDFPFKSVYLLLAVDRCCPQEIMKQYNVLHHCSSKTKQRTATFTQLITSVDCLPSSSCLNVAIRPQRPYGLLGTGSPGHPPRLSHSSSAMLTLSFRPYHILLRTGSPGRPPRLSHRS